MKYGLIYYKDTDNIGDDIQTYAASKFLPSIDYMIDRERLNEFVPDKKEYVKTIMNAWYVHDKFNFDISPYVYPLFISMFFKRFPYEAGLNVGIDYINDNVIDMFKKFGPVGTRDNHTLGVMSELGVDSYFSGCMTLTLQRFDKVERGDYIVVVGLKSDEVEYIKSKTNREVIEVIQDVPRGSFSNETWETRSRRVEDMLKLYQGAHMIITSKLHCSLPGLALETPVLLLFDDSFSENIDRIGTYLSYLNHINRSELFSTDIDFEKPKKNPSRYLKIRKNLIDKCSSFINDNYVPDSSKLISIEDYEYMLNRSCIQKNVVLKHLEKLCSLYENECMKSSQMYSDFMSSIEKLKSDNYDLTNRLNSVVNSKGWKLLEKFRKVKYRGANYIKVTDVIPSNNKLVIKYEVCGRASEFFEKDVFMEIDYDFDLSSIPKGILVIPFLSLFLPVAWATKSDIILDEIDFDFVNNIEKIRIAFNEMYSGNIFKKIKIKAKKTVKNTFANERCSLFFSGGVDSLDTLCSNFSKDPILVMIWGSDIWLEDVKGWNTAQKNMNSICNKMKKNKVFIKSNFRKTINELKLNDVFGEKLGDNWWHGVEHGMALLGHIAPLVPKYNIGVHYMPGTFCSENENVKCGSYPTIDENFKVSSCSVIHDGFNYTRLDKVKNIVKFMKKKKFDINFRTCYQEREDKMNCSHCEKCYRTIMELACIGEDPSKYGYEYDVNLINNIKDLLDTHCFEPEIATFWFQIISEIKKGKYFKKYDLDWMLDVEIKQNFY